jgi:hypothetical protein
MVHTMFWVAIYICAAPLGHPSDAANGFLESLMLNKIFRDADLDRNRSS